MLNKCGKCGAEYGGEEDCRKRFELCLAKEYENPSAYGAVHHLTVICYMLQHNEYSHRAWLEAREMLRQFVRKGITPARLRRENRAKVDGGRRKWSITQGDKYARFDSIVWTRTIADVRLDDPQVYCADVRQWAESVLADTERWVEEKRVNDK